MKRAVILGCGFVGVRVARLFSRAGWEVIGTTHSSESACRLSGEPFPVIACDITDAKSLSATKFLQGADAVISAVSSRHGGAEAYRQVYLAGNINAIALLRPARFLFVGSTSVYAQTDGSWVTEESPTKPLSETGRILLEAERPALDSGGTVARLAGIYGPGRSVLLRKFIEGTAVIEGEGVRHINQIHADDAAAALYHLIAQGLPAGIYNVTDDCPITQRTCFEWLAESLDKPLPPGGPIDFGRKRGVSDKRVSNAKLRALGWNLKYPSFREALALDAELLEVARADESGGAPP